MASPLPSTPTNPPANGSNVRGSKYPKARASLRLDSHAQALCHLQSTTTQRLYTMLVIMPPARFMSFALLALVVSVCISAAADGNRFTYLDGSEPFYPHREFPKLTTPQWVGEGNVEAVVVLSIDDMREPAKYEQFLRPILNRLKQIDGRAPLSIFCNALNPAHPQLQAWL